VCAPELKKQSSNQNADPASDDTPGSQLLNFVSTSASVVHGRNVVFVNLVLCLLIERNLGRLQIQRKY
jgi:hypothetical protein